MEWLNLFWELVGGVFALEGEVFRWAATQPFGQPAVVAIVLGAGLAAAIAQSLMLFINRVRPARFILTLGVGAILFVVGYFFLVVSTWLVSRAPFTTPLSFATIANVLGISYVPLLFSFLAAMPYLGAPLGWLLSGWHLIAMVVGVAVVADLTRWQAISYVFLGWVVLQILERTIGQPLANLGNWLLNVVSGVTLAKGNRDLRELLQAGGTPWEVSSGSQPVDNENVAVGLDEPLPPAYGTQTSSLSPLALWLFGSVLMLLILGLGIFLLSPLKEWLPDWYNRLRFYERLTIDLIWIGMVSLVAAAMIAPLEALGWWAGWYGDRLETSTHPGILTTPVVPGQAASRYVIYLDGVGQSNHQHLPTVERFLEELEIILPDDIRVIKGILPYSVLNNPLTGQRPLAFFWRLTEHWRSQRRGVVLGFLVNLRNMLVVAVSADHRYGAIYNRGVAQVICNGLLHHGYEVGSHIPLILIGYSGGAQIAAAAAPYLREALRAPIEIISLGGAISGNVNLLAVEHLYHLAGKKDPIERLAAIMFPRRWRLLTLSYWNRAKRQGKISLISLGPVGHNVPGGLFDPNRYLSDGRTYLQQTLDWVTAIAQGHWLPPAAVSKRRPSNYELFQQAEWVASDFYPLDQVVDSQLYRPIAPWMGRLILPERHQRFRGVWFEVHHAAVGYQHLVGRTVRLCWSNDPVVQQGVQAVTCDLHFSEAAEYTQRQGVVHPERINHWRQVDPLESLAGAHPRDDVVVQLLQVEVKPGLAGEDVVLFIRQEPVQITGRFYGLVQFVEPLANSDQFCVVHFNRTSGQFDGPQEVVSLPKVIPNREGIAFSTTDQIERSPLNQMGWYIYGAKNSVGIFVVQAIAPRALLRVQPLQMIRDQATAQTYLKRLTWENLAAKKGQIDSVLIAPSQCSTQEALQDWRIGSRALLVHVYGGIGGAKAESPARGPVYFGHFAYGVAEVVEEPLAGEQRFDIIYHQVYTHNADGIIAGSLHWTRYMGDRQFGWLGTRPVSDILIQLEAFTAPFDLSNLPLEQPTPAISPLGLMLQQLERMTARYRVGDGTGATYVGPANNCAQDSNQALYASIRQIEKLIQTHPAIAQHLVQQPDQQRRYQQLRSLKRSLMRRLLTFGNSRSDWEKSALLLGSTLEDAPFQALRRGLISWRTMLPRLASDTIVTTFLQQGGVVWILRSNQVGGHDPDIEPIAPFTLPF